MRVALEVNMLEIIVIADSDLNKEVASVLASSDPFASSRARKAFAGHIDTSTPMALGRVDRCLAMEERALALRTIALAPDLGG